MNPERFFVPRTGMNVSPMMMGNNYLPSKGLGLFGRVGRSIRAVNWGNLLSNANKTINVVNQAIPLVKQAGPMFNNMRSMFKIAKAFGNETSSNHPRKKHNNHRVNNTSNSNVNIFRNTNNSSDDIMISKNDNSMQKKEVSNNDYPNFFI